MPLGATLMKDTLCRLNGIFPNLLIALFVVLGATTVCRAQDELDDLLGAPVADPPAAQAGQDPPGQPAQDGQAASVDGPASSNMLVWTFQSLGWVYTVLFFVLSITLVTLIVVNLITARRENLCPQDLVEGVEQYISEGNPQQAVELIQADGSFLGQVVAAGLSRLERGHPAAIEAMQEVGEEETMKMEHNLGYMALIGNISPMIGLFGTVQGMIQAFRTIAVSGSTPAAGELAMDISKALFTTLAGLAIAIPAIAVYNILRNRVQRMTLQVGVTSEQMLEKFLK
jgi:biopolymer transport protein ExbB